MIRPPYKSHEVSEILGLTTESILRRVKVGEIQATKIGGQYYFPRKQFDHLLDIEETETEAHAA